MKRLFFSISLFVATVLGSVAQELDMMSVIENDPQARVGTLENGAKYYIRKNSKDPQRANFHILYDVGAVLEEDRQDGLAHFLEHMAFNGSTNFQGNGLIDYCQSIGIAFGGDLNAGTGQEMTTYMITNVPITREGIIDSMLLVLHDWAGFISLNEKDIDEERGVIEEEWRLYAGMADQRISRKETALLFGADNIYARRDIIGELDNLKNFSYQDIRDFYTKWYRPDLSAFVIVGDFDPDMMEAKLKKVMANVKPAAEKAKKPRITVASNEEPRYGVFTDPELTSTTVELICRLAPQPKKYNNRVLALKTRILNNLATSMLNERLDNIAKESGSPFQSSGVFYGSYFQPFDMLNFSTSAREGEAIKAFEAGLTELYRAVRGGYAEPELDRVKAKMLANNERAFNNRNDRRNSEFVNAFTNNYYKNSPIASAEESYELTKAIVENITLDEVNAQIAAMLTDENVVIYAKAQSKEGVSIPTESDLAASYNKIKASTIEPYTEEVVTRPLLDESALKGSKVAKTEAGKFESTVWTLKNGVKIVVKPTTYKADEVLLRATRKGGYSTIENLETLHSIGLWSQFDEFAGLSDFSAKELQRILAGKNVGVSPVATNETEGFRGSSSIKDIETLFQLTYLYATAPRFESEDWGVMIDKLETYVKGAEKDPMRIFQDSLQMTLTGGNPRALPLGDKMLSMVSLEKLKEQYKKFFSTTTDMTFFITGSVDLETLKPLVEKYIGSIPAPKSKKEAAIGPYLIETPKGQIVNRFNTPQESPRVIAVTIYNGDIKYSEAEKVNLEVIGEALNNTYLKTIREEAGGVYVVQNQMQVTKNPEPKFVDLCLFITDTSKVEELLPLVQQGVDEAVTSGPSPENLTKAKEVFAKNFADANNSNSTWSGYLVSWYTWGIDGYTNYLKELEAVTIESAKAVAEKAFSQGNKITMVQLP